MATGTNIHTYFEKNWHKGNIPIMNAADHGSWLGSTVFDGARYFNGVAPDLLAHCERLNQSAKAMGLVPTYSEKEIYDLILEGLTNYTKQSAVYIRPMYWGIGNGYSAIVPDAANIGFCICLEEIPMASDANTTTLTRTNFHRPILTDNLCNAKAGCLYPNNARMLQEASTKGFNNALVADAVGNVAETATSNVFLVKDGEIFTPIPNGTFLAGITRSRHIQNLKSDGYQVNECVLKFEDFSRADEVFLTGNMTKITPVSLFDDIKYEIGPVTKRARSLYFDWANSN
ncbi:MAG: branched chain amino acid aminotransferase [Rhodobacteraceae bacterium]|nr:branched chain amino acid aminotransferase [Paracoccaceae bacterium]MBL6854874.1 branched-chain amino acid aminotransferase [Paracoccaceae bacterium]|tara:strand:+ start:4591 stop:5451 length:861 start_codon:yes stop_codon:yes gene_type:complete